MLFFLLSKSQRQQLQKARKAGEAFTLRLSKKQIESIGEFENAESAHQNNPAYVYIPLNKAQIVHIMKAKNAGPRAASVSISKSVMQKGGFIPLIPLLLSALPGLLGAAPQILGGIKSGYENVAKLAGIKTGSDTPAPENIPAAPGVEPDTQTGKSVKLFGESLNLFGQSLNLFGPNADRKTIKLSQGGRGLKKNIVLNANTRMF